MNLQAKLMMSALCIGALPLAQAADFEDFGKVVRVVPQVEQINRPRLDLYQLLCDSVRFYISHTRINFYAIQSTFMRFSAILYKPYAY